jgi:RES domain-containing protein
MIKAFRICKTKYAKSAFDGEGAFRYGGRWNSRGSRVVYASSSLSLAVLEMLVQLGEEELLEAYSYFELEFDRRLVAKLGRLPRNWQGSPAPVSAQKIGDAWVKAGDYAILLVPSAVIPTESNYLINSAHKDFIKIRIGKPRKFAFDKRLK